MPNIPDDYSRTIAVLGRFRADRDSHTDGISVFGDEPGRPKVSAPDVFEAVQPELEVNPSGSLTIGGYSYSIIKLGKPTADSRTTMSLGLDSMLLEQAAGNGADYGKLGGRLLTSLLDDVDIVSRFAGPRLARALLKLAQLYLSVRVEDLLPDDTRIAPMDITSLLSEDLTSADAVLRVLTAFEGDLDGTLKVLRRALSEATIAGKADGRPGMEAALCEGVLQLRAILRGGVKDGAWESLAGSVRWLDSVGNSKEFGFSIGKPPRVVPGDSLLDLYELYMKHSENIHRFVRAPALRSFVFLWLMNKYAPLNSTNADEVGRTAYRKGVVGAGRKRLYGESDPDMAARRESAKAGAEKAREVFGKTGNTEDFEGVIDLVLGASIDTFRIERRFTRTQLQAELVRLFADAAAASSGALAAVIEESLTYTAEFGEIYLGLLGILNSEKALDKDEVSKKIRGLGSGSKKKTMEKVVKAAEGAFAASGGPSSTEEDAAGGDDSQAKGSDTIGRSAKGMPVVGDEMGKEAPAKYNQKIRNATLEVFAELVGEASMETALKKCSDSKDAIKDQMEQLRKQYRVNGMLAGVCGATAARGAAAALPTAAAVLDKTKIDDRARNAVKGEFLKAAVASGQASLNLPPRESVATKVKGRESGPMEGTLEGPKGTVAKVVIDAEGGVTVQGKDTETVVFETATAEAVKGMKLELPGDGDVGILLEEIDPEGEVKAVAATMGGRKREAEGLAAEIDNMDEYGRRRDMLRAMYTGDDSAHGLPPVDAAVRRRFERKLRALTLGEYIAAAPEEESRLGAQDVSETLRLVMDVFETVAELDNPELGEARPDARSAGQLGPEGPGDPDAALNLSYYFRVPQGAESEGQRAISDAIVYHRTLCKSVFSVEKQLRDVQDLGALAGSLPQDCRLVVVNRTLQEYLQAVAAGKTEFLPVTRLPSVLFLTHAADVGSADWKLARDALDGAYDQDENKEIACPLVIAAEEENLDACPFPVARLGGLTKVAFCLASEGAGYGRDAKSVAVKGAKGTMTMAAGMAVAAFARDEGAMGSIPNIKGREIPRELGEAFAAATGVKLQKGEPVVGLLRRFWTESTKNSCLESFVLARIASLAMGRVNRREQTTFPRLWKLAMLGSGGGEMKPEAQEELNRVAFLTAQQPNMAFYVDDVLVGETKKGVRLTDPRVVVECEVSGAAKASKGRRIQLEAGARGRLDVLRT